MASQTVRQVLGGQETRRGLTMRHIVLLKSKTNMNGQPGRKPAPFRKAYRCNGWAGFLLTLTLNAALPVAQPGSAAAPKVAPPALKVGTADQRGPLALPNLYTHPLGAAFAYGSTRPDLFVSGSGGTAGLYLFKWTGTADTDAPVFAEPIPVKSSFTDKGTIFQTADKRIHALWLTRKTVVHTVFNLGTLSFDELERLDLKALPKNPESIAAFPNTDGSLDLVFEFADGQSWRSGSVNSADWRPYDASGIWTGGLSYHYLHTAHLPALLKGPAEAGKQASASAREVLYIMGQITPVNLGPGHERDLIAGSRMGNFFHYPNKSATGIDFAAHTLAVGANGNALRHPIINARVIAYPNATNQLSDLIGGGEGALYFYRFENRFTAAGSPVYHDTVPVLQEKADLYAGTLPIFSVVDWNGDSKLDIIAGNSEGRVLFFGNIGSNDSPAFRPAVPVKAAGREIHIQGGYQGSIQGPQEARWGYTSPSAFDWNGDGLPDIVMGDVTGNYTIYLNRGTATAPVLDAAQPIYCDGLNLHGKWRVQPGLARLGNRAALVIVDGEDHVHWYWRIDDYNVEDAGIVRLRDGSPISVSGAPGGATGRCKLNFCDWNQDGRLDLVVGTSRQNAVPNLTTGYPKPTLGQKALATVLFMENAGGEPLPAFEHPRPFMHSTWGILQPGGAHECCAVGTILGGNGPNLLVGNETGRLFLLRRNELGILTEGKEGNKGRPAGKRAKK